MIDWAFVLFVVAIGSLFGGYAFCGFLRWNRVNMIPADQLTN